MTDRRWFLTRLPLAAAGSAAFARAQQRAGALEARLLGELEKIECIDTHEHILPEKERVSQPADFFLLAGHYAMNDVISSGLPEASRRVVEDRKAGDRARWEAFAPFWKHARFTGYGQALRIAIREVYGFEEISGATLPRINAAIAAMNRPGLYRKILKEKARIRFAVLDDGRNATAGEVDREFFVPARKFDGFVAPAGAAAIGRLEKATGVSITSLGGLKKALAANFERNLKAGMAAVKSTIAYARDLRFPETPEAEASRDFDALMRGERETPQGFRRFVERPCRALEDHMFHQVIQLAEAHGLPVQIHTGLHAGNANFVANTRASFLNDVFLRYPKVNFDVFHISYPYQHELAVMAKLLPNVYVDFCWAHIVSPVGARRALDEFLDTVPVNKIFGFGGDYRFPELSYAHLVMARRNIASVLAARTAAGWCTEDEAAVIGRMLLDDNPAALFAPERRQAMGNRGLMPALAASSSRRSAALSG